MDCTLLPAGLIWPQMAAFATDCAEFVAVVAAGGRNSGRVRGVRAVDVAAGGRVCCASRGVRAIGVAAGGRVCSGYLGAYDMDVAAGGRFCIELRMARVVAFGINIR